jgi:acyl-coenzyme A synthetase/AMP-(fatty) acid ligase
MMLMIEQGYQVSPAELEAHLLGLELVTDAGVIDEAVGLLLKQSLLRQ